MQGLPLESGCSEVKPCQARRVRGSVSLFRSPVLGDLAGLGTRSRLALVNAPTPGLSPTREVTHFDGLSACRTRALSELLPDNGQTGSYAIAGSIFSVSMPSSPNACCAR